MAGASATPKKPSRVGQRIAFSTVVVLLLFILVMIPFAISSVLGDVVEQGNRTYEIGRPTVPAGAVRASLHVDLTGMNEFDGTATLRVALHQSCGDQCPWGDRITFVSVLGDGRQVEKLPPSQNVTLTATSRDVTQTITLPIVGDPIRYPFDKYELALGVLVEHILPDGTVQRLSAEQARAYLNLSIRARIPRAVMRAPVPMDGAELQADGDIEPYGYVDLLTFERPEYMRVLTILLVLLVTAAAAYAVFLRPLDQLIINSGALVLGVWGIRSILLGTGVPGVTAVDLALSVVILFLLVAITVRTLWLLEDRSDWRILRRRRTPAEPDAPRSDAITPADMVPDRAHAFIRRKDEG
jgi:hypothetical protein